MSPLQRLVIVESQGLIGSAMAELEARKDDGLAGAIEQIGRASGMMSVALGKASKFEMMAVVLGKKPGGGRGKMNLLCLTETRGINLDNVTDWSYCSSMPRPSLVLNFAGGHKVEIMGKDAVVAHDFVMSHQSRNLNATAIRLDRLEKLVLERLGELEASSLTAGSLDNLDERVNRIEGRFRPDDERHAGHLRDVKCGPDERPLTRSGYLFAK